MDQSKVASAIEWLALPELAVPVIASTSEAGAVFVVHKVGFLFLDAADCRKAKIEAPIVDRGKCALPTVTADYAGQRTLCRLPLDLSEWALSCVAMAQQGRRPFPCRIEFGSIEGRMYAEML